jgi:hypothetical protein
MSPAGDAFSAEEAQREADELQRARITALITALDRVKLFLRHQARDDRVRSSGFGF